MPTTIHQKLHSSGVSLPEHVRGTVVEILNATLADLTDLKSQTKFAHWNVKGPNFFQVHELFDTLATEVETHIDTVAERLTALGGVANGTIRQAAQNSSLNEFPEHLETDMEFVKVLSERFAAVAANTRANIDRTDELGDQVTVDMYTAMTRELDKNIYFLDAHYRR